MNTCRVCRSISGEAPISPGPAIFDGRFWKLDHAYPPRLPGWLVIVLKRHAVALHDLTRSEYQELAIIQAGAVRALHQELGCAKEYVACFAELEEFAHLHIHIIPRPVHLPNELKGTHIFEMIHVTAAEATSPAEIKQLCKYLRSRFAKIIEGDEPDESRPG